MFSLHGDHYISPVGQGRTKPAELNRCNFNLGLTGNFTTPFSVPPQRPFHNPRKVKKHVIYTTPFTTPILCTKSGQKRTKKNVRDGHCFSLVVEMPGVGAFTASFTTRTEISVSDM